MFLGGLFFLGASIAVLTWAVSTSFDDLGTSEQGDPVAQTGDPVEPVAASDGGVGGQSVDSPFHPASHENRASLAGWA